MSTYKRDFLNPYGSIQEVTHVTGTGGFDRHAGSFSQNNPYLQQLYVANKNQDIDALYERAVEWEADQANYQIQLEQNRAILEEQREYDSPEEQIRRMREAGINPDIQGSSGSNGSGSGSAGMNVPSMADQQGQTKFSNSYDNANIALGAINTATSLLGTITGGFSQIVQSIDLMKTLPSRTNLSNAQATLANAQANEITSLLDGKKTAQNIQNNAGILSQLASLTDLISLDSSDENIISTLKSLNLSDNEETLSSYKDIIKQFHSNPEKKAKYYKDTLSAREQEAYNSAYSNEVLNRITTTAARVQQIDLEFQESQLRLDKALNDYLYNAGYATTAGQNIMESENLKADSIELSKIYLGRELDNYYLALEDIAAAVREQDKTIQNVRDGAKDKHGNPRPLTGAEQGIIDAAEANKSMLNRLGVDKFEMINSLARHAQKLRYTTDIMLNREGHMETVIGMERHNYFMGHVWDDVVNPTISDSEIFGGITKTIIGAATVGLGAGGASKVGQAVTKIGSQGFASAAGGSLVSPLGNRF